MEQSRKVLCVQYMWVEYASDVTSKACFCLISYLSDLSFDQFKTWNLTFFDRSILYSSALIDWDDSGRDRLGNAKVIGETKVTIIRGKNRFDNNSGHFLVPTRLCCIRSSAHSPEFLRPTLSSSAKATLWTGYEEVNFGTNEMYITPTILHFQNNSHSCW